MASHPPAVSSGQIISAAHINALRTAGIDVNAEIYAWTANVAAGGRNLTGVGTLTAASIHSIGASADVRVQASSSGAGYRLVMVSDAMHMQRSNDAFATLHSTPMIFMNTGAVQFLLRPRLGAQTTFANDTDAGTGGVQSGEMYWTSAGDVKRKI